MSGQHDLNIDVYLPQLLLLLPAKSLATRYLYGDYAHHTLMHASKEAWMHAMKYGLDIDGQLVNFSNQIQTICDVYLRRALGETVNVINVSSLTCVKRLVLAQRLMLSTLQTCELKQPLALIQTEILQGLKDRIKQELSELPADINDHTLPHLQKLWDIAELKLEQAGIKLEDQYLAGWKFTTQLGLYVTSYEKQKAAAQSLLAGEKSRFFADSSAQKENISTDLTQSPVQPAKSEWIHD